MAERQSHHWLPVRSPIGETGPTQQKGMHSQEVRLANVPPILASPPASNLIAFSGNVLTIPDSVRTGLQSVSPANGKTLASYEKMSERDVKDRSISACSVFVMTQHASSSEHLRS